MQKVAALSKKVLFSYKAIPDKKIYVEFITALLSIPVLLTVILLNVNNLKSANKTTNTTSTVPNTANQTKTGQIYVPVAASAPKDTVTPAANDAVVGSLTQVPCKPGLGSVDIVSPQEGATVTDNPVAINVDYQPGDYCAAVWSYRINNGSWSDYDDKSIALYSLPNGNIQLDLRVKSIIQGSDKSITRNFIYKGNTIATPVPTQVNVQLPKTASASAN